MGLEINKLFDSIVTGSKEIYDSDFIHNNVLYNTRVLYGSFTYYDNYRKLYDTDLISSYFRSILTKNTCSINQVKYLSMYLNINDYLTISPRINTLYLNRLNLKSFTEFYNFIDDPIQFENCSNKLSSKTNYYLFKITSNPKFLEGVIVAFDKVEEIENIYYSLIRFKDIISKYYFSIVDYLIENNRYDLVEHFMEYISLCDISMIKNLSSDIYQLPFYLNRNVKKDDIKLIKLIYGDCE